MPLRVRLGYRGAMRNRVVYSIVILLVATAVTWGLSGCPRERTGRGTDIAPETGPGADGVNTGEAPGANPGANPGAAGS